ncbi:tyrosine-protein phosphatase [Microbacterium sp. CH12i]|uniref:tyrosine-protein phosphatase n=1 Tax=Microbacterium sp. CH12i TaxID=1479651 RepID=UPI0012696EA9|nr:tyrosine-protein phosphatase [Microbacterium sp. CH12i]
MSTGSPHSTVDHSRRVVALEGMHNVRDLGGLPVPAGTTRFGKVFRGDFPIALTGATSAAEAGLPIHSIVDLRRGSEAGREQIDHESLGIRFTTSSLVTDHGTSWTATYYDYLVDGPDEIILAVRTVMDDAENGVYFHCAAGKDRTGVIAALLLDVLGVEHPLIVEDFLLTDVGIANILERLRAVPGYEGVLAGRTLDQHRPQVAKIEALLESLNEDWSGAEGWLLAHGLPLEVIERFRALMIAPDPQ